jgi:hypothetical protein
MYRDGILSKFVIFIALAKFRQVYMFKGADSKADVLRRYRHVG